MKGPIERQDRARKSLDILLPRTSVMPSTPSPIQAMVKSASRLNPASAAMKQINPMNQFPPLMNPKYGGKIRLPAPKNIAKSAKPNVKESDVLIFFIEKS